MSRKNNEISVLISRLLNLVDSKSLTIGELNGVCKSFTACLESHPGLLSQVNNFDAIRTEFEEQLDSKLEADRLPSGHIGRPLEWSYDSWIVTP